MKKVTIELFGLQLQEPSTYLSDIFLCALSLLLFYQLISRNKSQYTKIFAGFFLFMGLSTLTGGQAHLFSLYIPHNYFHVLAWSFSSVALYFFQVASYYDYSDKVKKILNPIFLAQLVISVGVYFGYQLWGNFEHDPSRVGVPGFGAVSVSAGIAMAGFVMPAHLIRFIKLKDNGSAIILLGLVTSVGALIVHSRHWGINEYFNYNVMSHVILGGCYYIYYIGVKTKVQQYALANS
ncbi:hypothetical protein KFE98_19200 [bacterium SCSIO 12741]|nr:hypothetical protein KFE98_19200 [bacterium SCSIO 12741]